MNIIESNYGDESVAIVIICEVEENGIILCFIFQLLRFNARFSHERFSFHHMFQETGILSFSNYEFFNHLQLSDSF